MILDTIDLKNNNWVPRNAVIKPKTLNEIAEEFTMAPTNSGMFSKPIERLMNNDLDSNTQKVFNIISNQSYF